MTRFILTEPLRKLLQTFIDTNCHRASNGMQYSDLMESVIRTGCYDVQDQRLFNDIRGIYLKKRNEK
jgi:hypothetical protein